MDFYRRFSMITSGALHTAAYHDHGHGEEHHTRANHHEHHGVVEHGDEVEGLARDEVDVAAARDERHGMRQRDVGLREERRAGDVRVDEHQRPRVVGDYVYQELDGA